MSTTRYTVEFTDLAIECLESIGSKRTQKQILDKAQLLEESPLLRGKELRGELAGYRSIHAAARYRIVFSVDVPSLLVLIVALGIRKEGSKSDVYEVTTRAKKRGEL